MSFRQRTLAAVFYLKCIFNTTYTTKIMKKIPALVLLAALLSCGSHKDFSKVKTGMTAQQVTQAVGEPDKKVPVFGSITHWHYGDQDHHIIVFENDTVENITDAKGAAQAMDAMKSGLDSLSQTLDSTKK